MDLWSGADLRVARCRCREVFNNVFNVFAKMLFFDYY